MLPLILASLLAAKPPAPPDLEATARDHGLEATWEAFQEMLAANTKAKHRQAALAECGLERVAMPVQLKMGAELTLSEAAPLTDCTWDGEHLGCELSAAVAVEARPEDYQVLCRTSFGATLPLVSIPAEVSTPADAPARRLGWAVTGVERCWEIGAVGVRVQPVSHDDLEGIGQGTDLIPPELAALSWQEAESVIMDHMTQFKYCYQRDEDGPSGVGSLKVEYHIAEDGTVDEASIKDATFTDERVTSCILTRFERLRFPPPMEGWTGGTFPFTFQR